MGTTTVSCGCGARITQREDFIAPAYVVTFQQPDTLTLMTHCPACRRDLYLQFRHGLLRPCA